MKKELELAIIGAGIAGVSAAIYARRSGLDFAIFEAKAIGGQLLLMEGIDNYVGLDLGTKGRDLAKDLAKTLSGLEIDVLAKEIKGVDIKEDKVQLQTDDCLYQAKAVIIATGAGFKKLDVEGEAKLSGRGVSYCAVCDGFFFKGKDVAVVGGGNAAVEEALYLAEIASKVTLIHRRDKLRAADCLQKDLFAKENIEVIFNAVVQQVSGDNLLSEITLKNIKTDETKSLSLNGLFVAIGVVPNTKVFSRVVSLDEGGFIVTDEQMQTSSNSIWACGDCRKRPLRQLITAASEGAIAAMGVYKFLKGHYISS
tara:strand:- start:872 stop:1804 length:933 start_codon:yes stop_codon:yes gene_type:complete